jgi:hypothetical protein
LHNYIRKREKGIESTGLEKHFGGTGEELLQGLRVEQCGWEYYTTITERVMSAKIHLKVYNAH